MYIYKTWHTAVAWQSCRGRKFQFCEILIQEKTRVVFFFFFFSFRESAAVSVCQHIWGRKTSFVLQFFGFLFFFYSPLSAFYFSDCLHKSVVNKQNPQLVIHLSLSALTTAVLFLCLSRSSPLPLSLFRALPPTLSLHPFLIHTHSLTHSDSVSCFNLNRISGAGP